MGIINFNLKSAEACRPGSKPTDHFAVVRSVMSRRQIRPRDPVQIPNDLLRRYDPDSLVLAIKRAVLPEHRLLALSDIATVEVYRLCRHPKLQLERIAALAVRHTNSVIHPVKPISAPDVNEDGIAPFELSEVKGVFVRASVYPTLPEEAAAHPVREVMTIPNGSISMQEGNIALRGMEIIIDANSLR